MTKIKDDLRVFNKSRSLLVSEPAEAEVELVVETPKPKKSASKKAK